MNSALRVVVKFKYLTQLPGSYGNGFAQFFDKFIKLGLHSFYVTQGFHCFGQERKLQEGSITAMSVLMAPSTLSCTAGHSNQWRASPNGRAGDISWRRAKSMFTLRSSGFIKDQSVVWCKSAI